MNSIQYPISLFRAVCLGIFSLLFTNQIQAQCAVGEHTVTLIVTSDAYGYEGYWELTADPNPCGTQTIDWGGNQNVGCTAGTQAQDPSGYGNNQSFTEGPWCLTEGAYYTIHYRDDWGDGGFQFRILIDGLIAHEFTDAGLGTDFTFLVELPPLYDAACYTFLRKTQVQGHYVQQTANTLEYLVYNYGAEPINSLVLSYSVDGATPVSGTVSGLDIAPYASAYINHPISWNPTADGNYAITFSVDSVNGHADERILDNTETTTFEVGPGRDFILDDYLTGTTVQTVIATSANSISQPMDLDFHPALSRKQLWIINKGTENSGGSTVTIDNTGEANQTTELLQDGNAWHFMSIPTGIVFSDNGNFGTAPGVFDANHTGTANAFTGPTLWSSDADVYAQPSGGNGSHIDMLHESPNCQGIAWEKDNVFWLFDGYNNDIVRYDFVNDHNPGNSDHSDAIVHRFSDVQVLKDAAGTVSHMEFDESRTWLYVVDNGHQKVFRMNIETGVFSAQLPAYGPHETMAEYLKVTGYSWENVVTTGLQDPAGIAIQGNRMVISDHQSSDLIFYDITSAPATELHRISTGAQGIMGITIGPDGKIYYVENTGNKVVRLDPETIPLKVPIIENSWTVFPNPSNGILAIRGAEMHVPIQVQVYASNGQLLRNYTTETGQLKDTGLRSGMYHIRVLDLAGKELSQFSWVIAQ